MKSKPVSMLYVAFSLACGCNAIATNPSKPASPSNRSSSSLNWVLYTDSAEGAFSTDVPLGWQVQGGMYRFGYFDVRWMMDVRSLDGKVIMRIDDPDVPPYVLPGPHSGPAGHAAIKPQMCQMMVDNYREAQPYAEGYAKRRFSGVCKSFIPRQSDWTPSMPSSWRSDPGDRVTQATVTYDCSTSDGPRIVTVYARNTLHSGSGLWQVDPIISIIATPQLTASAQSMIQHMIDSWQENPQWLQHQQQLTNMGLAQIRAGFGQFMQQMQAYHQQREAAMNQQMDHFEAQQRAQAQQVSSWGEMLTGLTNVTDPVNGTRYQIFSGPKANNYINGSGVIINSNLSPGPGFHQLN